MKHFRFAGLEFRFFLKIFQILIFVSVGKGSEFRIKNRKLQIKPCTTNSRNFYMQYVYQSTYFKVHVFWEGYKNWQNQFDSMYYVVTVKSRVKISSMFLAFLENMNFTIQTWKFCNHIGLFAVIRSRSKSREIFWSIIDQAWSQWGELISVGAFSIILKCNFVCHHQIFVFCMDVSWSKILWKRRWIKIRMLFQK